jgi:outer membrane protein TolC
MSKSQYLKLFAPLLLALALMSGPLKASNEANFYAENARLRGYVQQALDQNPALQESLARYRAVLQRVPQVTALPDPMLSFTQFIRNVETRVGPQLNTFMLSQKFPWFGKLDLKGQVVFKEATAQYQAYRAREREIIVQVKRAFYDLSYVDRAVDISREEQALLEYYEELAQARYSTGQGLQQSVIKMQAEMTQIINRLKILDQQRRSLVGRLNTLMDKPPQETLPRVERLALPEIGLDLEALYQLGERNRPELKAAMAHIEKSEQSIELAKKEYWPNLTVGAGMINVGGRNDPAGVLMPPPDNGKNAFNFSVGINIPIRRDKYSAGVLEATEGLIANRRQYLTVRNEMEYSIRDQAIRIETLKEQVELFEQVLVPQAEAVLRSTESAYQTGQLGALDLLDSERMLWKLRLIQARYDADYLRALANLERAVGTRFPAQ